MKTSTLILIAAAAVAAYFLWPKKKLSGKLPTTTPNTGDATTPPGIWAGWDRLKAITNPRDIPATVDSFGQAAGSVARTFSSIYNIFTGRTPTTLVPSGVPPQSVASSLSGYDWTGTGWRTQDAF